MVKNTAAPETVTVNCSRCRGTGFYAIGSCFGCGGAGTFTYTAAVWKRKQAAAKRREVDEAKRRQVARDARTAELDAMTRDELIAEIPVMMMVFEGDLVQDWSGEHITIPEMADRMIARRGKE